MSTSSSRKLSDKAQTSNKLRAILGQMSTDPAFPYIQLCISSMALSNDVEFFPVWQQLGEKPAKNCLEHMQVKEQ